MKCPHCGWTDNIGNVERGHRIKAALEFAENVGRPRRVDYQRIYEMRDRGNSLGMIANKLNVSRGTIQHALKVRGKS